MQLIKRKPHLGWIINILAILLICFLMLNSLFGSIYVNQLKKKILGLTDHYFLAQKEILETKETLAKSNTNIYKFVLFNRENMSEKEIQQLNSNFLKDLRKDFIAIVSHTKEINKFNIDPFMTNKSQELLPIINSYTLNLQKDIEHFIEMNSKNYDEIIKIMQKENDKYLAIIFNLEILARLIQDKTISIRISDDLLLAHLPSVFIITFFAAAITGGSFIYVSRREVRKSITENTLQVLNEAREYQLDCIETLETCKELSGKGFEKFNELYSNLDNNQKYIELIEIINNFKEYAAKVEFAFETRRFLHEKEKNKIEQEIKETQKSSKEFT